MKSSLFFIVSAAVFLFLLGQGISESALRLANPQDMAKLTGDVKSLAPGVKGSGSLTVPVRLAGGESEGVLVLLNSDEQKEITIRYDNKTVKHTSLQVFRVENVSLEGASSVPDPLIPLSPESKVTITSPQLFYIKVTALPSALPAGLEQVIAFSDREGGARESVKLSVTILPVTLPYELPITVQASIWPYEKWPKDPEARMSTMKKVLSFLAGYRINGAAGILGGLQSNGLKEEAAMGRYRELLEYCFDDLHFRRVRIPAKTMYNRKKPMALDYPRQTPPERGFEKDVTEYLNRFAPLMKNQKWTGKLGFKIWDEPQKKDYPDVVRSYRAVKMVLPELRLELSEQPEPELQNVADVWTTYIKFLKPEDVSEQHRLGKEMWLYANKVHGIDQPLYGMRILGWVLWEYDLDGYLLWAVNWWKEDPWKTASSEKKDFFKRGTLIYPGQKADEVYPSLRLEAFRDGMEDLLLLRELEKMAYGELPAAAEARALVTKLKKVYNLTEKYDNAPDPAKFREDILAVLQRRPASAP